MPLAAAEVSAQREALSKALAESRLDDCRALLKTLKAGVVPTEELIRVSGQGRGSAERAAAEERARGRVGWRTKRVERREEAAEIRRAGRRSVASRCRSTEPRGPGRGPGVMPDIPLPFHRQPRLGKQ
jgi:hypothetical protein